MGEIIVIGITGGVGAGKSTVLSYLKERYNAMILMADMIAKRLMEPGGETYQMIINEFGQDLLNGDKTINKELLAKRIFQMGEDTSRINDMVHPEVVKKISQKIEAERLEAIVDHTDSLHLVVVEAALLFEGHADSLCDEIWYIHSDKEIRISRLMESRGYSREKCLAIMKNQLDEDEFIDRCDVLIDNSFEFSKVKEQIDRQLENIVKRIDDGNNQKKL